MSMASICFLGFVILVLLVYYVLPEKYSYMLLLCASIVFYFLSGTPWTIIYLLLGIAVAYWVTCYATKNKAAVVCSIIVLVGMLGILKYTNLMLHTINIFGEIVGSGLYFKDVKFIASLGISFYTLQLVGYILECCWGTEEPQRNFLKLALFGCYFPGITSGPILRYSQVKGQLYQRKAFSMDALKSGFMRIAWGLIKTWYISEKLSVLVTTVYSDPDTYSGLYIIIATFLFSFQLYADFSGCMDIALGASECFGIILPENFQSPFMSKSVQEFWRRWHITLGTWLKDYIMNPLLKSDAFFKLKEKGIQLLGKKQGKKLPVYVALLVLWSCMGIWHGNSWKYVVGEGLWFWLVIVLGQILDAQIKKLVKALKINTECFSWKLFQGIRTFCIFSIGMLFFRAESLMDAIHLIKCLMAESSFVILFDGSFLGLGLSTFEIISVIVGSMALIGTDIANSYGIIIRKWIGEQNFVFRLVVYTVCIVLVYIGFFAHVGSDEAGFIYAQF